MIESLITYQCCHISATATPVVGLHLQLPANWFQLCLPRCNLFPQLLSFSVAATLHGLLDTERHDPVMWEDSSTWTSSTSTVPHISFTDITCSNTIKPYQTISNHIKPYQSISNHIKPYQTISNHIKPYQTTKKPWKQTREKSIRFAK